MKQTDDSLYIFILNDLFYASNSFNKRKARIIRLETQWSYRPLGAVMHLESVNQSVRLSYYSCFFISKLGDFPIDIFNYSLLALAALPPAKPAKSEPMSIPVDCFTPSIT